MTQQSHYWAYTLRDRLLFFGLLRVINSAFLCIFANFLKPASLKILFGMHGLLKAGVRK